MYFLYWIIIQKKSVVTSQASAWCYEQPVKPRHYNTAYWPIHCEQWAPGQTQVSGDAVRVEAPGSLSVGSRCRTLVYCSASAEIHNITHPNQNGKGEFLLMNVKRASPKLVIIDKYRYIKDKIGEWEKMSTS